MKQMLVVLALLASTFGSAGAQTASGLHPFIVGPPSQSKEELVKKLRSHAFRPDRNAFVALFDQKVGQKIGKVFSTFDELIELIESDEVKVVPCNWTSTDQVNVYGLTSKRTFGFMMRDCYAGEQVLSYKSDAFLSLYCGNLLGDDRKQAEAPAPVPVPAPAPKPRRSTLWLQAMPGGDDDITWLPDP